MSEMGGRPDDNPCNAVYDYTKLVVMLDVLKEVKCFGSVYVRVR